MKGRLLLNQASEAYFNCEYEKAYGLAQDAMKSTSVLFIPESSVAYLIVIISILLGGYYMYRHPKQFKKKSKKSK